MAGYRRVASQSFGGIEVVVDETLKVYQVHGVEYLDKLFWLCVQLSHDLQQFLYPFTFSQFACLQYECHNGLLLDTEYHGPCCCNWKSMLLMLACGSIAKLLRPPQIRDQQEFPL